MGLGSVLAVIAFGLAIGALDKRDSDREKSGKLRDGALGTALTAVCVLLIAYITAAISRRVSRFEP